MRPFVFNASVLGTVTIGILGITWFEQEWKGFSNYFERLRHDSWYIAHGIMGSALAGLAGEFLIKNE